MSSIQTFHPDGRLYGNLEDNPDKLIVTGLSPGSDPLFYWSEVEGNTIMLHAETLNKLLTQNTNKWVAQLMVFTPDGLLLGNSKPANEREMRSHVSILAQAWANYNNEATSKAIVTAAASKNGKGKKDEGRGIKDDSMMCELEHANIVIQLIKPKMLLAMVGPSSPLEGMNPPDKSTVKRTREEQQGIDDMKAGAMGILRLKSDAMLAYLQEELATFEMPAEM